MTKINFSNLSGTVSMATGGHVEDVAQWGLPSPEAAPDPLTLTMTAGQPVAIDAAAHFFGSQLSFALAPSSEALPDGLSLSQAGWIEGTAPLTPTALALIIRASNANGFAERTFTVSVLENEGFTVTMAPDAPFVGEVVHIDLIGSGNLDVPDPFDDIDVRWDTGVDATYQSGARNAHYVNDARRTNGREIGFPAEAGARTLTYTANAIGEVAQIGSVQIPAGQDPATFAWDRDIYLSYANDFSEAPPASSTVLHFASHAEMIAASGTFANRNIRLNYHAGEVFLWNTDENFQPNAPLMYMDRFGTGADPILRAALYNIGAGSLNTAFRLAFGNATTRVIARNIEWDDNYNPVTGERPSGDLSWFERFGAGETFASFYQCKFNLGGRLFQTSVFGDHHFAIMDCVIDGWSDYIALLPKMKSVRIQGNLLTQPPNTTRGDGKILDSDILKNLPSHGHFRMNTPRNLGVANNEVAQMGGWSDGDEPGQYYIQPIIRVTYSDTDATETSRGSIRNNLSWGNSLFSYAATRNRFDTTGAGDIYGSHRLVVEANRHTAGNQMNCFGWASHGGLTVQNNVIYVGNIDEEYAGDTSIVGAGTDSNNFNDSAVLPILIRHNTLIIDRTAQSTVKLNRSALVSAVPDNVAAQVVGYGNIIKADAWENAASLTDYEPMSPADDFQHTAASAAHQAITSGSFPYADFDGKPRSLPTSIGPFHDAIGSVTPVAAPVNIVAPTIAASPAEGGVYYVSDQGTWDVNFDPYQVQNHWYLDGVFQHKLPRFVQGDKTGTLTCHVVATNESGVRVAGVSNAITS